MEPVIRKGIGGDLRIFHYDNENIALGAQLTDVNCTVFKRDGEILLPETAVIPATDGAMKVTITAAMAESWMEWCRARFTYRYIGSTIVRDLYFHVADTDFEVPFHYEELSNFAPNLADYAWADDQYFGKQRNSAILELYSRLVNGGTKPWKVLNRSALKNVFALLWLAHIYAALSRSADDSFSRKASEYRQRYGQTFAELNLLEQESSSANVNGEEAAPLSRTRLKRG
jgi:hypothetical protein